MNEQIENLVVTISGDLNGVKAALDGVNIQLANMQKQTASTAATMEAEFATVQRAASALGVALSVAGAVELGKTMLETAKDMQLLNYQMLAAVGTAQNVGQAWEFVRDLANKFGLDLMDTANGFASFALNAMRTGLTLESTEKIFEGFSVEMRAVGLTTQQVSRTMYALQEIMTMGQVQTRQLRMLNIDAKISWDDMAKAMGVTTEQFHQMVKAGSVVADDFLPKLASVLQDRFTNVAEQASQSLAAELNRLGNAWIDLQNNFANNGGLEEATHLIKELTDLLKDPQTAAAIHDIATTLELFAEGLIEVAHWAEKVYELVSKLVEAMSEIPGSFADDSAAFQQFHDEVVRRHAQQDAKSRMDAGPSGYGSPQIDTMLASVGQALSKPTSGVGEGSAGGSHGIISTASLLRQVQGVEGSTDGVAKLRADLDKQQQVLEQALQKQVITKQRYDTDMAAVQTEFDKKMADYIANNYGTEADKENQRYADEMAKYKLGLDQKLITFAKYHELVQIAEEQHQDKMRQIDNKAMLLQRTDMQKALDGFLGIQTQYQQKSIEEQGQSFAAGISQASQHNKQFFELEKAAAIARALISARQSVVDAYAFGTKLGGPILGATFAAVAAAAQAANIAAIASTSYSGNNTNVDGSTTGLETGGSDALAQQQSANTGGSKTVNIVVQGDFFGAKQVRDLADKLGEFISDGTVRLNVGSA